MAAEYNIKYYETSAKNSIGVEEVFLSLIKEMDDLFLEKNNKEVENPVNLNVKNKNKNKKNCC